MKSCIYEGLVRHHRFSPKQHKLSYRTFMMYLDLDELDVVFRRRWFWSTGRFNLAQFRRHDHAGDPSRPLRESISQMVEDHSGRPVCGPIRLLTNLRYFGYCFNPVSFYYCFDETGRELETIVAEVHNTPWNERHCYILDPSLRTIRGSSFQYQFDKAFHVSPFMSMDLQYRWCFKQPGQELLVEMQNLREGNQFFEARLALHRFEISSSSLARVLVRYPFMTGKVAAAIYWNALLLWLKGFPVFSHPKHAEQELQP